MATEKTSIYAKLLAAQRSFPKILKTRTARAGTFTYQYADLSDILGELLPILHEHGLLFMQRFEGTVLLTELYDEAGESISSALQMPSFDNTPPQGMGSWLTYLRRYALSALLGIAAEDDDDAQTAQVPPPVQRQVGVAPKPTYTPPARPARSGELSDAQVNALMNLASKAGDSVGVHGFEVVNSALKRLGMESVEVGRRRPAYLEALKAQSPNFEDFQQAVRDVVKELMGDASNKPAVPF